MIRFAFFLAILFSFGCGRQRSKFTPLKNGFGYVVIAGGIDSAPGEELHFRGPDGRDKLIWDNVVSPILITNDMAIFAGERLAKATPDEPLGYLERRLFAVRAPGPAVDITTQVFWIGARAENLDTTRENPNSFLELKNKTDQIIAVFTLNDMKRASMHVTNTWDQVAELLHK